MSCLLARRRGAMFIDALLGVYIVAIAAILFAATMGVAVVSRAKADERTKAVAIVDRQLESIQNLGYGNLSYTSLTWYDLIDSQPTQSPFSFADVGTSADRVSTVLPGGTGTVSITDLSSTVRKVTVTVSWISRTGNHSVSASTELANLK